MIILLFFAYGTIIALCTTVEAPHWKPSASERAGDAHNQEGIRISGIDNIIFEPVHEPATLALMGMGLIGLARNARKRKR